MPGLAIIINEKQTPDNLRDLESMVSSMKHEAFYNSGHYSNEELGVYIGWTCHKGSYSDPMPVTNKNQDRLLFFFGEHHPSGACVANGAAGPGANAVMHLVEEHGDGFLRLLNGWYHGVLVDLAKKEVAVFTDRYGMQRLYHHRAGDSDMFASEAKALLKVKKELRSLDMRGLGELFSCGCVLDNRSLFSGIVTVPAGSLLRFRRDHSPDSRRYFTPSEWEDQTPLQEDQFKSEIASLVPKVMRRYLLSSAPLAISLTGGFDTRMIMAYINEACGTVPCYTFGGLYRECFDVKIARKIAAECGCPYQVINLKPEFLSSFPELAHRTVYLSDGNLGAFNAYELYLNRLARQVGEVRLTGSYGSEVIRGARAFKAVRLSPGLLSPELERSVDQAIETFGQLSGGHNVSFSVFKQAPWYYGNRLSVEQSQLTVRTPFLDNELVGLMYRAPDGMPRQNLSLELIERGNPELRRLATDTGNASRLRGWFMQALFKADYCYKSGMPQWLERIHSMLGPFQPERFLIGIHRFAHPRVWIRKDLASYIQEILLDPLTLGRGYFDKRTIQYMVSSHIKGVRNYTDDIERVLSCELLCRTLIDS